MFASTNDCRDKWWWKMDIDGSFSVKTLLDIVEKKILATPQDEQATIWNNFVPKKVNIFVWRALKNRIPVKELIDKKGIELDSLLCPVCSEHIETFEHCLIHCESAKKIWDSVFKW